MNELDPAAPDAAGEVDDAAKNAANFGIGGAGDFPPGDPGLNLAPSFATATVAVSVEKAMTFLHDCENSHPRVTYGLGKKILPGQIPGRDFTKVDCSGFVREVMRRSTNLGNSFPDGSVVQHDWVRLKGFARDTIVSGSQEDRAVRIAFLPPNATQSGIGHVVLVYNGATLESHGGVGPDSRPWTGSGWEGKTFVYILAPSPEGPQIT